MRRKSGGRQKGTHDKKYVARDQLRELLLKSAGLDADEAEALQPLAVMRFCMAASLRAGDYAGALLAAQATAPYVHPRLASADVRVHKEDAGMTDCCHFRPEVRIGTGIGTNEVHFGLYRPRRI